MHLTIYAFLLKSISDSLFCLLIINTLINQQLTVWNKLIEMYSFYSTQPIFYSIYTVYSIELLFRGLIQLGLYIFEQ